MVVLGLEAMALDFLEQHNRKEPSAQNACRSGHGRQAYHQR